MLLQKLDEECRVIRSMLPSGRTVILKNFFLIDIQYVCYIENNPKKKYLPCEIAVVKYSLSDGVITDYHSFCKPGNYHEQQLCVASILCVTLTTNLWIITSSMMSHGPLTCPFITSGLIVKG